ncbi:Aste57867_8466 [Aphanomyces stellatus]|uniref:Aste57867_8466 protein n=1 Tax=Aphanomyces stellatus TaxID=120398 RepID=A0A485KKE4_9STRA|nr:hypothetical protein As57867_008434 [Aphanomyces stellatus]VFT85352.1 Aste57867_8466 [Aphanomyces stellatus]
MGPPTRPLFDQDVAGDITASARDAAASLLQVAYSDSWASIPVEADGVTQFRNDSSMLGKSDTHYQWFRTSHLVHSSAHELAALVRQLDKSDAFETFLTHCLGKTFVQGAVDHTFPSVKPSMHMSSWFLAHESITLKWAHLDITTSPKSSHNVHFVDIAGTTTLERSATHQHDVFLWCMTSLRQHAKVTNEDTTTVRQLGFFWRPGAVPAEVEVIVCGSFPSQAMPTMVRAITDGLCRLDDTALEAWRLRHQVYALRTSWVPNSERQGCVVCLRAFHALSRRRHHCRRCGDVVCYDCSIFKPVLVPILATPTKIRFCKRCYLDATTTPLVPVEAAPFFDTYAFASARDTQLHLLPSPTIRHRPSVRLSDLAFPDLRVLDDSTTTNQRLGRPTTKKQTDDLPLRQHTLDQLCQLARNTLRCPIAVISVDDRASKDLVTSTVGVDSHETLVELASLVDRLVLRSDVAVVTPDTLAIQLAKRPTSIRFLAGVAIRTSPLAPPMGYICVADTTCHVSVNKPDCVKSLHRLAALVAVKLNVQ